MMNLLPQYATRRPDDDIAHLLNSVQHSDALALLRRLPDASVDLIATDPPYGLAGRVFVVGSKSYKAVNELWDYEVPITWLSECRRVLKPTGSLICFGGRQSIYQVATEVIRLGYRIINDITWFKPDAMPNMTGRMMTESTERALWISPHGSKWFYDLSYAKYANNGQNYRDVWVMGQTREHRVHPTQKPLEIMERICCLFSPLNAVVCDPFSGSGTTAIAARKTGRRFICGDITQEYVELACKRLQDTDPYQATVLADGTKQLSLFEGKGA